MSVDHSTLSEPGAALESATAGRMASIRKMLVSEFHIESAFVGVPKLSRILGIAPSTIYGYMRAGKFFMTYRMVNSTAMVSLDDLAEWIVASPSIVRPLATPVPPSLAARQIEPGGRDAVEGIVDRALREMGISSERRR